MGSLKKNVSYRVLLNLFNIGVPMLIGPYVLRKLGPASIGNIYFADSVTAFFFAFGCYGINKYAIREISRIRDNKQKLSNLFSSLFIISFCLNLIISILYLIFIASSSFNYSYTLVLSIYSFTVVSSTFYVEWAIEALEEYKFITLKSMLIKIIYVILIILFVRTSEDFPIYAALQVALLIVGNLVSCIFIAKRIPLKFDNLRIKKHITPLITMVFMVYSYSLFIDLDKFMLGKYVSDESVSFYTIPMAITRIIRDLLTAVLASTVPRLTNYLGKNNDSDYFALLNKITKIYFLLLFPISTGLFIMSDKVILLYGGYKYINSIPVMKFASAFLIFTSVEYLFTQQILFIYKKEKQLAAIVIISGLINLLLDSLLAAFSMLTPVSTVITTLIGYTLIILTQYIYIKFILKLNYSIFSLNKIKYFLASLLFIPLSNLINPLIESATIASIITVAACSLLYISILLVTKDSLTMDIIKSIKRSMSRFH